MNNKNREFRDPSLDVPSDWSASLSSLFRIDWCLRRCGHMSRMRQYIAWYHELEILKREAIVKMKKENHTNCSNDSNAKNYCFRCHCVKLFDGLRKDIQLYEQTGQRSSMEWHIRDKLDEVEIFLRTFMDKKGMLIKDSQDLLSKMFLNQ